ncbi:TolC family protein [Lentisphaerota bacterium ZTH]|nr:TolC family protein [Lentisphaerota bacterium]WET07017.1 TolC family protein [Lentisphaerota bacterium ZTH]
MQNAFRLMTALAAVYFLAGCHSAEEYREERVEKARKHFEEINKKVIVKGKVFTLPMCIRTALKHNLDLKVYELKERIAQEKVTASMLGMLPDLEISNQFHARNRTPGSSSQSIETGKQSLVSSRSTDNTINNIKIELALSVVDFGLAYLNAAQAEDRSLITVEQQRRAAQNLTLDVVKTYFKVAAAQDAIQTTEKLLVKCRNLEKVFATLSQSKAVSPLRLLDERKRFIQLEKRLMAYRRSYQNACIELRALMGYLPINDVRVDTRCLEQLNVATLPDISVLEKIALVERPELYQLDIQTNITVNEARKTILMMFPNVKMFVDFVNSNNSFLYTQSWWEIGVRAAYNLLKLPEQIARYRAINSQVDEISMRTLALSIGVMAQVRIAHANILEVKERFELDDKVYKAYSDHLNVAKKNYSAGSGLSQLELDRLELETAETFINRIISMSNYYVAYYRLLNTVGISSLDQKTIGDIIHEIKLSEAKEKARTTRTSPAMVQARKAFNKNVLSFNGIALGQNTMTSDDRKKLEALIPKNTRKESGVL